MGAWRVNTFDNDFACDWMCDLEDTDDLSLVEQAFDAIEENGDEYLEADLASEALAACEVVACLKGNPGPGDSSTESLDEWIEAHPLIPSNKLVERALAAIDRVTSPESELLEVWIDSDTKDEWLAAVADLRTRVHS